LTIRLLDVNVLLALHDQMHPLHHRAYSWFQLIRNEGWATCPITENGFVRIVSGPGYSGLNLTPASSTAALALTCHSGHHQFWPDDISVRDFLEAEMRITHRQFPDLYLLALALEHGGKLTTLDEHIPAHVIPGGADVLEVIPI
jgi:toxin-antitoxin system PIN domain toxin